jgi:hypothetical protein
MRRHVTPTGSSARMAADSSSAPELYAKRAPWSNVRGGCCTECATCCSDARVPLNLLLVACRSPPRVVMATWPSNKSRRLEPAPTPTAVLEPGVASVDRHFPKCHDEPPTARPRCVRTIRSSLDRDTRLAPDRALCRVPVAVALQPARPPAQKLPARWVPPREAALLQAACPRAPGGSWHDQALANSGMWYLRGRRCTTSPLQSTPHSPWNGMNSRTMAGAMR